VSFGLWIFLSIISFIGVFLFPLISSHQHVFYSNQSIGSLRVEKCNPDLGSNLFIFFIFLEKDYGS
jgi:hypothetical protein